MRMLAVVSLLLSLQSCASSTRETRYASRAECERAWGVAAPVACKDFPLANPPSIQ